MSAEEALRRELELLRRQNQEQARINEELQRQSQQQLRITEQLQQQSQQQSQHNARLQREIQELKQHSQQGSSQALSQQIRPTRPARQAIVIHLDEDDNEQPGLPGEVSRNRRKIRIVIDSDDEGEVDGPVLRRRAQQPAVATTRTYINLDYPEMDEPVVPRPRVSVPRPPVQPRVQPTPQSKVPELRIARASAHMNNPEQSIPSARELYNLCDRRLPNDLPGYREFRTVYTLHGELTENGTRMMESIRTFIVDTFLFFNDRLVDDDLKTAGLARMNIFARERVGKSVHVVMIAFLAIECGIFPIITIGPYKNIPVGEWLDRLTKGYNLDGVQSTNGGAKNWKDSIACLAAAYTAGDFKMNIPSKLYEICRLVDVHGVQKVPVMLLCDEADESVRGNGRQWNPYTNEVDMTVFERTFHRYIRKGVDGLMFVSATLQGTICTKADYGDTFDQPSNLMIVPTPENYLGIERYIIPEGCEIVNGTYRGKKLTEAFFEDGSPFQTIILMYFRRDHPYHKSRYGTQEGKLDLEPTDHQEPLKVHPSLLICITSRVNDSDHGIIGLGEALLVDAPVDTAVVAWVGKPVVFFKNRDGFITKKEIRKSESVSSVWKALKSLNILPDFLVILSWTAASKGTTFTEKPAHASWISMPLYAIHYVTDDSKGDFSAIQQRVLRSANDCMTWTFTDDMKIWTAMSPGMLGRIQQSTRDFEDYYRKLAITRDTFETGKLHMETDRVDYRYSKSRDTLRQKGAGMAGPAAIRARTELQRKLFDDKSLARQLVDFHDENATTLSQIPDRLLPYTTAGVVDTSYYQNAVQSLKGHSFPLRSEFLYDANLEFAAREQWKIRYDQEPGARGWDFRAIHHIANDTFCYDSDEGMEFDRVVQYVRNLKNPPQDISAEGIHRCLIDNHMTRATASNTHRVVAFEELDLHGNVKLADWVLDHVDPR